MRAADCRIVGETETKIGVGLLVRPTSASGSKADAVGPNQIRLHHYAFHTDPTLQVAEFHGPSDAMAERRLVLLPLDVSTEGGVTDEKKGRREK